jgi:hypothetical protein
MVRTSGSFCQYLLGNGEFSEAAVYTFFHCGTGKAGDGSWQLADAIATQVTTRSIEKIAIGGLSKGCDRITEYVICCS